MAHGRLSPLAQLAIRALPGLTYPAAGLTAAFNTAAEAGARHKFGRLGAQPPGFCVECVRALIAHDPGLQFEGLEHCLPVLRIERELAAGGLDVFFGLLKTSARLERYRFIEQPTLYVSRHRVAVRAQDHEVDPVHEFEDVRALGDKGFVLATRGTAYASYLLRQPGLKVDDGGIDHLQNLRKLMKGRGRFFYQSEVTISRGRKGRRASSNSYRRRCVAIQRPVDLDAVAACGLGAIERSIGPLEGAS